VWPRGGVVSTRQFDFLRSGKTQFVQFLKCRAWMMRCVQLQSTFKRSVGPLAVMNPFSRVSLRTQANRWLIFVVGVTALLQMTISPLLMLREFRTLEDERVSMTQEATARSFAASTEQLMAFTLNFASWSETYRFARGNNPGYLASNLVPSTFQGGAIDLWIIDDRQGRVLAAATFDRTEVRVGAAVTAAATRALAQLPAGPGPVSGVVRVGRRTYLIGSRPITQDDGTGNAGRMTFARELTPALLATLVPLRDATVTLQPPGATDGAPGATSATLPLRTPTGQDAGALVVSQPVLIVQVGQHVAGRTLLITLLCSVFAFCVGSYFVNRRVLQPLEQYDQDVSRMQRDPSHTLDDTRSDELGRLAGTINALVRHQRHAREMLQRQRERDGLTGLRNWHGLTQLDRHFTSALAVQVINLRDMSGLYGPVMVDRLMIELAARLRDLPGDLTSIRIRSDTFAVFGEFPDPLVQHATAELLRPYALPSGEVQLRGRFGLTQSPAPDTPERLLEQAELALQEAADHEETLGRYTESSRTRLQRTQLLRTHLTGAAERGELFLVYMPIVEVERGHVRAVEALLRWHHPTLGSISPAEFIPLAEQSGQIYALGLWVLRQATAEVARHPSWTVSVNVSPAQLLSPTFAQDALAAVAASGLPLSRLVLEITEGAAVQDFTLACAHMDAVREQGVRVALDDFGTGQSSLSLLPRLPLDSVKLDRSFMQRAARDPSARTLLRHVVALAADLNLPVVAEGIETPGDLRLLKSCGCTYAQGFLWGTPDLLPEVIVRCIPVEGLTPRH
jgi:predicted signal transduction protein with EAL and GGDEF domain